MAAVVATAANVPKPDLMDSLTMTSRHELDDIQGCSDKLAGIKWLVGETLMRQLSNLVCTGQLVNGQVKKLFAGLASRRSFIDSLKDGKGQFETDPSCSSQLDGSEERRDCDIFRVYNFIMNSMSHATMSTLNKEVESKAPFLSTTPCETWMDCLDPTAGGTMAAIDATTYAALTPEQVGTSMKHAYSFYQCDFQAKRCHKGCLSTASCAPGFECNLATKTCVPQCDEKHESFLDNNGYCKVFYGGIIQWNEANLNRTGTTSCESETCVVTFTPSAVGQ